jgi:hypothetical protein
MGVREGVRDGPAGDGLAGPFPFFSEKVKEKGPEYE